MTTMQAKFPSASGGLQEEALTMAVAIVAERIARLPEEDKQDLFELVKALAQAQGAEEFTAAVGGMREILDQQPQKAVAFLPPLGEPSAALVRWNAHIAGAVRKRRENAHLTQQELAAKTGLTQSHISRIENAELSPSHRTVDRLAAALGVEPSEIDPTR
ncbi:MAG: helix-turn-helix domain-containing protein [Phycisphaerae bacterium]